MYLPATSPNLNPTISRLSLEPSNSQSPDSYFMEKLRSFSIKPTRFLVFSFRISFSVVFLIFFSIWVIRITHSLYQETHFNFRSGLKPLPVRTLTGFSVNSSATEVKSAIFIDTQFRESVDPSEIPNVSSFGEIQKKGSEHNGADAVNAANGTFAGFSEDSSVNHLINSVLIATNQKRPENTSAFGKGLVYEEKGIESEVSGNEIYIDEAINGNSLIKQQHISDYSPGKKELVRKDRIPEKSKSICDITKGKWVFDENYPLYTNASCPFIDEGFNCQANGRLDKDYMKWRWQPQDCDIPRFNATKMLNLIRGKRLVFVGDSINRNQWESMLCLLMGAIKDPKRVYETHGRRITKEKGNYCFKFLDYKCTVEYYVSHYLVHESKAKVDKKRVQTLRIDTMDRGSSRWKRADILVFNTAHWWSHYKTKSGVNYYQEGEQVHPHLDISTAFQKALMTWGSWLDRYINPSKTQVFFRSSAPSHFRGGQWNAGGRCREALRPVSETSSTSYPEKNIIVEEVLRQLKIPVTLLNITNLSDHRVDGHPSVYGRRPVKSYSSGAQDCSHWCLPGVPDTWNELLYFLLQS